MKKQKLKCKEQERKTIKNNNGITLIALVITIIVLLILAGVTIATLTGDNGILTRARDAKTSTEIGEEKEKVELSAVGALAENNGGEITENNLEKELTSYIGERDVAYTLTGTGPFTVTYTDSSRSYIVDTFGNVKENDITIVEPENPDDWEYTVENGVATLTKYLGDDEILIVPNYIDGIPVKQVGDGSSAIWDTNNTDCVEYIYTTSLFEDPFQIKIREVIISDGIEIVGSNAFVGIIYLNKVHDLPSSITTIGDYAFAAIMDWMYSDCLYIRSEVEFVMKIPKTVVNVGACVVGKTDNIEVEFKSESEIPSTWDIRWAEDAESIIWAQ